MKLFSVKPFPFSVSSFSVVSSFSFVSSFSVVSSFSFVFSFSVAGSCIFSVAGSFVVSLSVAGSCISSASSSAKAEKIQLRLHIVVVAQEFSKKMMDLEMLKFSINKKSDFIKIGKDQNLFTASLNYIVVLEQDARLKKSIKFSQEIKAFSVSKDYLVVGGDLLEICFLESGEILQKDYRNVKVIEIFKDFIVIATESELIILKIYNQDIVEFQKIPKEFVISVKVGNLPGTQVTFIITGGTDNNLNVFLLSENSDCFVWKMVLKGHKDWVKSIDVKQVEEDLMMASASQDGFIRLWKISRQISKELNTNAHSLEVGGECFYLTFHSLLVGHEDWVNSVRWYPDSQELKLVSASADKSIIIWSFDQESGVWYNQVRLGDVGGTVLGYYGALVLPGGRRLLAHGYHGALQAWDLVDESWVSDLGISGHSSSVQDICWNPSGSYLLSTSLDQTTRLYAEWNRDGEKSWHEMARTQIHGYDLQVLAFINEYEYVSGADEKILRVFEANRNFVESLEGITQTEAKYNKDSLPVGASLPTLGLSNKALYEEDITKEPAEKSTYAPGICRDVQFSPPLEVDLLQNTLWPEKEKLYGHGFEIMAVGTSKDGKYVASSCKASKAGYASIILWSAEHYKKIIELPGHALTVTTIVFSPDGQWLVSAGRDRSWILHQKTSDEQDPYRFHSRNSKSHSRIIWKCSWSADSQFFATASRDKYLKIWSPNDALTPVFEHLFDDSVTSCDFLPYEIQNGDYMLAVGLESGNISILYISRLADNSLKLKLNKDLPFDITPSKTVKAVKWRPGQESQDSFELAACSSDYSVRIFSISN